MQPLLVMFRPSCGVPAGQGLRYDTPQRVRDNFGGLVLEKGLFRIYTRGEADVARGIVTQSNRLLASHIEVIAGDWLGRFYAWDTRPLDSGAGVSLLDPTEGEFEVCDELPDLFDKVLPEMGHEVLEVELFNEWRLNAVTPNWMSCASMVVPFELGGELVVSNLELADLSVHWGVASQISQQLRRVEPGESVHFSIDEAES